MFCFRLPILYHPLVLHSRAAKTVPGSRTSKSLPRKILSILRTNSAERIENYSKRLAARHVEITMLKRYNFASTLDIVGGSVYNVKSFRILSKCPPWTPISAKSEHVILINANRMQKKNDEK